MYQAEGSERTEAYLFSRQQSRRESFGCTKQTGTQVQDTQCVLLPNLIGKANGKPSDTATAAEKKTKKSFPSSNHHWQNRRRGSGTHVLPNFRQDVSALATLIHYLRQIATKETIIHLNNLAPEIFLLYCMNI